MAELHKNLKSLRRERKIDLEAIEKRTKIDINYLKAIESGKFEILPSTYIRLFLKAYCVEIGADPVDALHQLDSMQNKNKKKPFISEKEVLPNEDANDTKNESSIIDLSPLAPVFCETANFAISFNASSFISNLTPSIFISDTNCLTIAFLGSVIIRINISSSNSLRVVITGSLPMNSGIIPNFNKS